MSHQDWTEIKWEKPTPTTTGPKQLVSRNTNSQTSRALLDPEIIVKPKTWPRHCCQNVQKLRLQVLKIGQDEFAKRLNVNVSMIKNLENGKGTYDGKLVQKINQVFKVNINSP